MAKKTDPFKEVMKLGDAIRAREAEKVRVGADQPGAHGNCECGHSFFNHASQHGTACLVGNCDCDDYRVATLKAANGGSYTAPLPDPVCPKEAAAGALERADDEGYSLNWPTYSDCAHYSDDYICRHCAERYVAAMLTKREAEVRALVTQRLNVIADSCEVNGHTSRAKMFRAVSRELEALLNGDG